MLSCRPTSDVKALKERNFLMTTVY